VAGCCRHGSEQSNSMTCGISVLTEKLQVAQEGLCCIWLISIRNFKERRDNCQGKKLSLFLNLKKRKIRNGISNNIPKTVPQSLSIAVTFVGNVHVSTSM